MKVLLIFICIIQNIANVKGSPLENGGEKCWGRCNKQEGKCDWCGTEGWCCRKDRIGNGCDGTFGGSGVFNTGVHHECHLHPGMYIVQSGPSSVSSLDPLFQIISQIMSLVAHGFGRVEFRMLFRQVHLTK